MTYNPPSGCSSALLLCIGVFACGDDTKQLSTDGSTDAANNTEQAVDPSLFLLEGLLTDISEVDCTLSDGSTSTCYSITMNSVPSDHAAGPWCPTQITDGAEAGGIWPESGVAHDVTGAFVENLSDFYEDDAWQLHNPDGSINYTETAEECAAAARPDVDPELQNHCVQCLPSYLEDEAQYTYTIPKTPVLAQSTQDIRGNMGVAFNGVEFAASAPTEAILGAYTLAPFDDCGGHINLVAGYHYHAVTSDCLTKIVQSDGHAAMIGYAMDGFAMHEMINEDSTEPSDLDPCRGHSDTERGYHYHVSGAGENMIIGCWNGLTVDTGDGGGGGPPGG